MTYTPDIDYLLDMLRWQRPEGSIAQTVFCELHLEPVFGKPDEFGNYFITISNNDGSFPEVAFMAHHDTVHFNGGFQTVETTLDTAYTPEGDCLGADCTTGLWIILEMIEAEVPGIYIIHGGEEVGCLGSSGMVASKQSWMEYAKAAISFDRYGTKSVVTHQMSYRTCSDEFADSLIDILDLGMEKDKHGVFTDSNEYRDDIPECTNLSVGYEKQHTKYETQDLDFLRVLVPALIEADWSKLVIKRDPKVVNFERVDKGTTREVLDLIEKGDIEDLIYDHAAEVADYLHYIGYTAAELKKELGLNLEDDDNV